MLPTLPSCPHSMDEMKNIMSSGAQPLRRIGVPEDIGEAVAFITDDRVARFITGTDFVVDGGNLTQAGVTSDRGK